MRNKKALETIEVWMWLIAGLIIGSLIFVAGYSILSTWFHDKELQAADEGFALLKASVLNVCKLGSEQEEVRKLILPRIINNISIQDAAGTNFGTGSRLCIDIKNEALRCINLDEEPNTCMHLIIMKTIDLNDRNTLFYTARKAASESDFVKMRFVIAKQYNDASKTFEITVNYAEEFIR